MSLLRMCRSSEEVPAASQPPGVLLLLARVCTFLETEAVVQVMETLASHLPWPGGGLRQRPAPRLCRWQGRQVCALPHFRPCTYDWICV